MRVITFLFIAVALVGCATTSHNFADDRPGIGVQGPKPMCSSGPNGKTAACATAIVENAVINSKK
jgi:hypothetical protein